MTRSKKLTNVFLGAAFAVISCGATYAAIMPAQNSNASPTQAALSSPVDLTGKSTVTLGGETFKVIGSANALATIAGDILGGSAVAASSNYILSADIDLSQKVWTPIGTSSLPFTGKFNGNGHTIRGAASVNESAGGEEKYYGIFGKVGKSDAQTAMIYDLIVDDFSYSYDDGSFHAGRLAGYVENATLIDIYDMSYVNASSVSSDDRWLKTFGTVKEGVTYYIGDTFLGSNGTLYKPGVYDPTHGSSSSTKVSSPQFDISNPEVQPNLAGFTYMIVGDNSSRMYEKGTSVENQDIGSYRIAINTTGANLETVSLPSYNYYNDIAKGEEADAQEGQPVIESTALGKKFTGFKAGSASKIVSSISDLSYYKVSGGFSKGMYAESQWKTLYYNLTIVDDETSEAIATKNNIPYNKPWADVVKELSKTGHDLTKLYEGSNTYYSAVVENIKQEDDSYKKVITPSYPLGEKVRIDEGDKTSPVSVTLRSVWQAEPVNTVVNFTSADTGVDLSLVSDISVSYQNTELGDITISKHTEGVDGKYTFLAVAKQKINLKFKLPAGYSIKNISVVDANEAKNLGTDENGITTIELGGMLTSNSQINIELQRETISVAVTGTDLTFELSGNSAHTTLTGENGNYTLSTKIGENFNIVVTPVEGYQYVGYEAVGFTTVYAPTGDGDVKTFRVQVDTYGSDPKINFTSRAKAFSLDMTYNAQSYENAGVSLSPVTITVGETIVSAAATQTWENLPIAEEVTVSAPANDFYSAGVVTLIETEGSTATISGENGVYKIKNIAGGSTVKISVSYSIRKYEAQIAAKYAVFEGADNSHASSFGAVKDANGNEIEETSGIITFSEIESYQFGQTLTLSYNLVSQFYEFEGWYYSNGDLISTQNNFEITAPAANLNVYAVVRGKTSTLTVANGTTIFAYDGTTGTKNVDAALATSDVNSVTFRYSSPNEGKIVITVAEGYNVTGVILYNPALSDSISQQIADGVAVRYAISGLTINGYGELSGGDISKLFTSENFAIIPEVTQKTATIAFNAGLGNGIAVANKTFYYGGEGLNLEQENKAFTRPGYTASGWTFTLNGQTYTANDSQNNMLNLTSFNGILNELGKTITLTRVYTANKYKIYFDVKADETLDTTRLTEETEGEHAGKYYKQVTFDSAIGILPTATSTGKTFYGWGISEGDTYATVGNTVVSANWNYKHYKVVFHANGGVLTLEGNQHDILEVEAKYKYFTFEGVNEFPSVFSREGFIYDSVHWLTHTVSGDGTEYVYKREVSEGLRLTAENFEGLDWEDENLTIDCYVKWRFDEEAFKDSLTIEQTISERYGSFSALNFNAAFKGIHLTEGNNLGSIELKLGGYEWLYSESENGEYAPFKREGNTNIYADVKNVSESGFYKLAYTIKDTISIETEGFGTDPITITSNASNVVIEPAEIKFKSNEDKVNQLVLQNLKYLVREAAGQLNDMGDNFVSEILRCESLEDVFIYIEKLSLYAPDFGREGFAGYVFSKPVVALSYVNPTIKSFLAQMATVMPTYDLFKEVWATSETFADFFSNSSEINKYAMVIYGSQVLLYSQVYCGSLESDVSSDFLTSDFEGITAKEITLTPTSSGNFVGDNNGGVGYYKYKIEIEAIEEVDFANFSKVIKEGEKYFVILGAEEISVGNYESIYIYAPTTTFALDQNAGVEKGSVYTFTLEKAFEEGSVYAGQGFTKAVINAETGAASAGVYSSAKGNLVITSFNLYKGEAYYTITRGSDGAYKVTGASAGLNTTDIDLKNFAFCVDNAFEIIEAKALNRFSFSSSYAFAAETSTGIQVDHVEGEGNYNLTISSVRIEIDGTAKDIAIVEGQNVYYDNGNFLFELAKNGEADPVLYATGAVKSVTVSAGSVNPTANRYLVDIVKDPGVVEGDAPNINYANLIKSKTEFASNATFNVDLSTETVGGENAIPVIALYSDGAFVNLSSLTDTGVNANLLSGESFNNFASAYALSNTAANAYELLSWTVDGQSVDASEAQTTLPAKPNVSVVANFALAKPEVSIDAQEVAINLEGNTFNFSSLNSSVEIANEGEGFTYTYAYFKKVGDQWQSVSSITPSTLDSGTYAVEVNAAKAGYNNRLSDKVEFELTFNKVAIAISAQDEKTFTYKNANIAEEFNLIVQVNNGEGEQIKLKSLLAGSEEYVATLTKDGKSVSEIKDAGTYQVSIVPKTEFENKIALSGDTTFTITVSPFEVALTAENSSFTKKYRAADPLLEKSIDGVNEKFIVSYTRAAGENAGDYEITSAASKNSNYSVSLPDAAADRMWFHIEALSGATVTADVIGDVANIAYAGAQDVSVEAVFVPAGEAAAKWTLEIKVGESDAPVATFDLANFILFDGTSETEVDTITETTLQGIVFEVVASEFNGQQAGKIKNVGAYSIAASGTNPNGVAFDFSANTSAQLVNVVRKELSLSNISKQFDRTTAFNSSVDKNTVTVNGIVSGESVVVTGQFASAGVGEDIVISNLAISGENASNYVLASEEATGKIVKSDSVPTITIPTTSFTYGNITKGLDEIAVSVLLGGADVSEYVNISLSIDGDPFSTGNFLRQGTHTIKIAATSDYYTIGAIEDVTITVSKLNVTVSVDGEIVKVYDKNNDVLQKLTLSGVLAGDQVTVSGAYASETPAEDIAVTFTLGGEDAANYNLTNSSSTGKIESAQISISAELDTIEFVDGGKATGTTTFNLNFPFMAEGDAEAAFNSLAAPEKAGYEFKGWATDEALENALTAENFSSVLDSALASKSLTIYAKWEIKKFTVTINLDENLGSFTVSSNHSGFSGNVYTFEYYQDVTVTSTANVGYVALNAENIISHIAKNEEITLNFASARVEFVVDANSASLFPQGKAEVVFEDNNWQRNGDTWSRTLAFADFGEMLAKDFLPNLAVKGYSLTGWTSGDTTVQITGEATLEEIVLKINPSFTKDIKLNFAANFAANKYTITFNADNGDANPDPITAVYGQAIGALPVVTKTGYEFAGWKDEEGNVYTNETIYALESDVTLIAQWSTGVYEFTINAENATVVVKEGNAVLTPKDGVYRLSHEGTYTIEVTANAGYAIDSAWTLSENPPFEFSYVTEFTSATVSNLSAVGSISIIAAAQENTISIEAEHAKSVSATIDGKEIAVSQNGNTYTFSALTGKTAIINVQPEDGWEIRFSETTAGKVVITENGFSLSAFTSDAKLTFVTEAKRLTATVSFNKTMLSRFEIISGGELGSDANTIIVRTGTELVINPIFATGYELDNISAEGAQVQVGEDGYISISGFTGDISITINAKAKTYNLEANLYVLDKDNTIITDIEGFSASVDATGEYNTPKDFIATKTADKDGYQFLGWFEGEVDVIDGSVDYNKLTLVSRDMTYSHTVKGDASLTAIFKFGVYVIKASVQGQGQILMGGEVVADSKNSMSIEKYFGDEITLEAKPQSGYEFKGWSNGEKAAQITINVDGALDLVATFEAKALTFDVNAGVYINGVLYEGENLDNLNFGEVVWGSYDGTTFTKAPNGDSKTIETVTDGEVYIQVTTFEGYTFDNIYAQKNMLAGSVDLVSTSTDASGNAVNIFKVYGLNGDFNGQYGYSARFVANSTNMNLTFTEDDAQVEAGHIVADSANGITISGNRSANVVIDAVTGSTIKVTASVRFGFKFAGENPVSSNVGTILNQVVSVPDVTTGYAYQVTFEISGHNGGNGNVIINVLSESYVVILKDNILGGEITIENVKIGQELNLNGGITIPDRANYLFEGYFTYLNGAGKQYIGKDGQAVKVDGQPIVWSENGYSWNGQEYVQDPFYKGNNTFELYASYIISKTTFIIDAVPPSIKDAKDPVFEVRSLFTNINEANSWTSSDNIYLIEVLYGGEVDVAAPDYNGYEFHHWVIETLDENGNIVGNAEINTNKVITNLAHAGVAKMSLTAVYYAKIAIRATEGGTAWFTYNTDVRVDDEAYLPTDTEITLHALAQNGYKFIGWFDRNGNEISKALDFTVTGGLVATTYTAMFEGNVVTVNFGNYDQTDGRITGVSLNGEKVEDFTSFEAKIGDEIFIYANIDNPRYFEVNWQINGKETSDIINRNNYYLYKINVADTNDASLTITPKFVHKECEVDIHVSLMDSNNTSELKLAGSVKYVDRAGNVVNVNGSAKVTCLVGGALEVEIIPNMNYKVESILFNGREVTADLSSNKIVFSLTYSIFDINSNNFVVEIIFAREMWIDAVDVGYQLRGQGTSSDPYVISSAEDLAFMSRMINVVGSEAYANACYVLGADISLIGKYWSPIGTEQTPFNGTFDFASHDITNVEIGYPHVYNGSVQHKIFGVVGEGATFKVENSELTTILIVVGVVIFLIILAIVLFFVIRRQRRKKLEELANS